MAPNSFILCTVVAACLALAVADWSPGMATFYGGVDGSGTMGGTCGYDNLYNKAGYGVNNAALSEPLFNDGVSCGQCNLITCDPTRLGGDYCKPGNSITVSATNLCLANYTRTGEQVFAECPAVCRVQNHGHSAKNTFAESRLSAKRNTRQMRPFAECNTPQNS